MVPSMTVGVWCLVHRFPGEGDVQLLPALVQTLGTGRANYLPLHVCLPVPANGGVPIQTLVLNFLYFSCENSIKAPNDMQETQNDIHR